jgi:hypothetical protein
VERCRRIERAPAPHLGLSAGLPAGRDGVAIAVVFNPAIFLVLGDLPAWSFVS